MSLVIDINDPRVVHLTDVQEDYVTAVWATVESALTDDGKNAVEAILCFLVGVGHADLAAKLVDACRPGAEQDRRLGDTLDVIERAALPDTVIRTQRIMGVLTRQGTAEHASYIREEDMAILFVAPATPAAPSKHVDLSHDGETLLFSAPIVGALDYEHTTLGVVRDTGEFVVRHVHIIRYPKADRIFSAGRYSRDMQDILRWFPTDRIRNEVRATGTGTDTDDEPEFNDFVSDRDLARGDE